jgi:hypothetical protein
MAFESFLIPKNFRETSKDFVQTNKEEGKANSVPDDTLGKQKEYLIAQESI